MAVVVPVTTASLAVSVKVTPLTATLAALATIPVPPLKEEPNNPDHGKRNYGPKEQEGHQHQHGEPFQNGAQQFP